MWNRRDAVKLSLSSVAVLTGTALAQGKAAPAKKEEKPAAATGTAEKWLALVAAAEGCSATGRDCLDHCIDSLSTGDKMMADCARTVRTMLPLCSAVAELARLDSPHLKALAAVCAKACRDCEKECQKHASHHAQCKACAEACAKCAAECEKV